MRELLLKNRISKEKSRKIISVSELSQRDGLLAHTERHLIYLAKEAKDIQKQIEKPFLYILRERDSKQKKEKLFFKVKGNFYVVTNERLFLVFFCHSFKIELSPVHNATPSNSN